MNNNFVQLKDFPNYEINIKGEVRNIKTGRILKARINTNGYLRFSLKNKNGKILEASQHRLLKLTFDYIDGCENLYIDHINGIRTDNRMENLDWVTAKENIHRAIKSGTMGHVKVLLNDELAMKIRKEYIPGINGNLTKLQHKYKIGRHSMLDLVTNRIFTHLPKTEDVSDYFINLKDYPYYSGPYYDKIDIPKHIQEEIIYKFNYYHISKISLGKEYKISRKTIESIIFGKYKNRSDRKGSGLQLTEKDVLDIKNKIKSGIKKVDIAKEYGMHPVSISNIYTGKTWSHLN